MGLIYQRVPTTFSRAARDVKTILSTAVVCGTIKTVTKQKNKNFSAESKHICVINSVEFTLAISGIVDTLHLTRRGSFLSVEIKLQSYVCEEN
jgi:hypothetical protein